MLRAAALNQASVAITGGTIVGSNLSNGSGIPILLSKTGIPFIWASSGSIGNNGALTGHTAVPADINGKDVYILLPAGAIAAGVPAAPTWYFASFTSTTAATIWNSTYVSGTPVAGTKTAFVTTGPGAYTGITALTAGPVVNVPANSMGANGAIVVNSAWRLNNTAGTKTTSFYLAGTGGTAYMQIGVANAVSFNDQREIRNTGVTNKQAGNVPVGVVPFGAASTNDFVTSSVDTTSSTNVTMASSRTAATDFAILNSYVMRIEADGN